MSKSTSNDAVWVGDEDWEWVYGDKSPLMINVGTLCIEHTDTPPGTTLAGPFESLEAAKAAYLVMMV